MTFVPIIAAFDTKLLVAPWTSHTAIPHVFFGDDTHGPTSTPQGSLGGKSYSLVARFFPFCHPQLFPLVVVSG